MSEEQRKKVQEARRIGDNWGFAAAVAHLYGPNIRTANK